MERTKKIQSVEEGRRRVIIEGVTPEIQGGRFPIKRAIDERIVVEADVYADGHDAIAAVLLYRRAGEENWNELPMEPLVNDRWRAAFGPGELGRCEYTVEAWIDHFRSWQRDTEKKIKAGMDVAVELMVGAQLLEESASRANDADAALLRGWARELLEGGPETMPARMDLAVDRGVAALMRRYPDRRFAVRYKKVLQAIIDPVLARFSAWYEMFPRSFAATPGQHGTFRDCIAQLPRVAGMGFDILYLPPVHPIGRQFRKGRNNNPVAEPGEPGSPWGIGAEEGGHKAVHPELGSLEDFRELVRRAKEMNLHVALDIAFQCSPDHPYVREHPQWFKRRPDGSIQYAENPPKKYQDIYPIDFETDDWENLWIELKSIFEFWIEQGVYIFRVDNPHTKAFRFWEWAITELKREHRELIFLSEAFTRPKPMYRLAKLGFTQSYNYFPWRNTKQELTEYLTELTQTEVREYFRPNLWPNTPDILPQYLQYGGRPAFIGRLVLAATMGASYGIYGPAFELCDNRAKATGSEEYLDSEKYEIKQWNFNTPDNLTDLVCKVNKIRRENPALHRNESIRFHPTDNEQIIVFSKATEELENVLLVVVNLDPHHVQSGWVNLSLQELGVKPADNFQVHDLLTGARYIWNGPRNYVELRPSFIPAHIFRVRRRARTEQDFDYYM